jgi:hypothetical protein
MLGGYSKPCEAETWYSTIPISSGEVLSEYSTPLGCYAVSTGTIRLFFHCFTMKMEALCSYTCQ